MKSLTIITFIVLNTFDYVQFGANTYEFKNSYKNTLFDLIFERSKKGKGKGGPVKV